VYLAEVAHLRTRIRVLGQSVVSDEHPFVDLLRFMDLSLYRFGDIYEQYSQRNAQHQHQHQHPRAQYRGNLSLLDVCVLALGGISLVYVYISEAELDILQ
jgi:hypothetical protein